MPIVEPNPVAILPLSQSSAGSLKDPANQIVHKGSQAQNPDLWFMVSKALISAQNQIDPIVQALRAPVPNPNLIQVLDSQGNLQVQLGDIIGTDNKGYAGLWVLQLFIGGKGPGDPNSTIIQVGPGGVIIIPTDLEVVNLTVDNDLVVGNLASIGGDLNAQNITAGGDLQVDGTATVGVDLTAGGTLTASGVITGHSDLNLDGDLSVGGTIGANGAIVSNVDVQAPTGHFSTSVNTGNLNYTGGLTFTGGIPIAGQVEGNTLVSVSNINTNSGVYQVGGTQVLESRRTGWTSPTGTVSRASFDQSTVSLAGLAQRVAALIEDLLAHGLIGA